MGRNFGFLFIGAILGFVLANLLKQVEEKNDPEVIADDLENRLRELEAEYSRN